MEVFLSHGSVDKPLARRIARDLLMPDIGVWFDEWEIRVGHSTTQKISRGLDDADLVVVLLSSHSVESGWVEKEWSSVIGDEATSKKVLVLPAILDDCTRPRLLKDKTYADFRTVYAHGFQALLLGILDQSPERPITGGSKIARGRIEFDSSVPDIPMFRGMLNTIEQGCFVREDGRLHVYVNTVAPNREIQGWAEQTGLSRLHLTSADLVVSTDAEKPTSFQGEHEFTLPRGFKMTQPNGSVVDMPFDVKGSFEVKVDAHASAATIEGTFEQTVTYKPCAIPLPKVSVHGTFTTQLEIE